MSARGFVSSGSSPPGQCSPDDFWYDHDQAEWVLVLKGAVRLEFEDRLLEIRSHGDFVNILADKRHQAD